MLNKHHTAILLCVIHKNKRANLTSNFVDENFVSKTDSLIALTYIFSYVKIILQEGGTRL